VETLIVGKRNYHSHRSSMIAILTIKNQATTSKELQMDGFSSPISPGYQV
jgi:hypothetical protein